MVKRSPERSTKLLAEAAALEHLHDAQLQNIPTILHRNTTGPNAHLILSWLTPHAITLESWWQGATIAQRHNAAHHIGRWFAALHQVYVEPGPVKLSDDPLPWHERLLKHIQRAQRKLLKRRHLLSSIDIDGTTLEASIEKAQHFLHSTPWNTRPRQMMHRDIRPPNIIMDSQHNTFAGVVDFERAGAGDPAWDFVKLHWWCADVLNGFLAPFEAGYTTIAPLPNPTLIAFYKAFEAITMMGYFLNRHDAYPQHAARALSVWNNASVEPSTSPEHLTRQ